MSHLGEYQGPMRYIRVRKQTLPRQKPEILEATITIGGHTCVLDENRFKVHEGHEANTVYIYHQYNYFDEDGNRNGGRWYNVAIPIERLQTLPPNDTFEYTLDYYEDAETFENIGPMVVTLKFTPKAAAKLRGAA
jgi:hypothetical protein